jgi:agmatinase
VHEHGPAAAAAKALEIVGDRPAYLTFDIDCLDPAFAPGTGTPVPGGLSTAQALSILRRFVPLRLIGMDVVEVSPPYDQSEITALAAALIATEMLCLLSEQRGQQQARTNKP